MKNLHELWGNRFINYMTEFQRYMKYVFTGHLAIVFVFTIGAGGYAYSEWLKEIPADFPAALLIAVLIAASLAYSPPVTLLKPADAVYLLPLETKLHMYLKRALRWSVMSQIGLPLILFVVAIPLLAATGVTSKMLYLWIAIFIIALKFIFVDIEYCVRHVLSGEKVWLDRAVRFVLAGLLLYLWLGPYPYLIVIVAVAIGLYFTYWQKRKNKMPFPYNHFIEVEQNRMMRFYRFANYFTDVPHLKGSVSRRGWLGFFMRTPNINSAKAQSFLIRRTFIRTDDSFWLWVRLTALSILGASFIPFPIVVYIFSGALAFASSIQLVYALRAGYEFRMDMLFPINENSRSVAIRGTVRSVQYIQALVVTIAALFLFGLTTTPFLLGVVVLIVSEVTIRMVKEKK